MKTIKRNMLTLISIVLILFLLNPSNGLANSNRIRGEVQEIYTHRPLSVQLKAYPETNIYEDTEILVTRSNSDGIFVFTNCAKNTEYTVCIDDKEYYSASVDVMTTYDAKTVMIDKIETMKKINSNIIHYYNNSQWNEILPNVNIEVCIPSRRAVPYTQLMYYPVTTNNRAESYDYNSINQLPLSKTSQIRILRNGTLTTQYPIQKAYSLPRKLVIAYEKSYSGNSISSDRIYFSPLFYYPQITVSADCDRNNEAALLPEGYYIGLEKIDFHYLQVDGRLEYRDGAKLGSHSIFDPYNGKKPIILYSKKIRSAGKGKVDISSDRSLIICELDLYQNQYYIFYTYSSDNNYPGKRIVFYSK